MDSREVAHLPRPKKNYVLFLSDTDVTMYPEQIIDGQMGPLPLLLEIAVGYCPREVDHVMSTYQSQEILYAYKLDRQFRVLLHDSFNRTLSLPAHSTQTFCVENGTEELTLSQILGRYCMPVRLRFARPDSVTFVVDKKETDHSFFGPLQMRELYEEQFYWCLSIYPHGSIRSNPTVLPRNLLDVAFAPITGIRGAADPSAKLEEFLDKFSLFAEQLQYHGDPFFQDLAFVSRGPELVFSVEPYIDETTFITVIHKPHPSPSLLPPGLPPRANTNQTRNINTQNETASSSTFFPDSGDEDGLYDKPPDFCEELPPPPPMCMNDASSAESESESDTADRMHAQEWKADRTGYGGGNAFTNPPSGRTLSPPVPPPKPRLRDFNTMDRGKLYRACMSSTERPKSDSQSIQAWTWKYSSEADDKSDDDNSSTASSPIPLPPASSWPETLATLSIDDISVKLKELGLDKYRSKFRKAHIDGLLLQKLTQDVLRTEFKMQHLEMIRLNAFISEGHIPRRTPKKSQIFRS